MFDFDGICKSENHRIWTVNREEANRRSGKQQQGKFAEKVMIRLSVCSENVVPLILFLIKALLIIIVASRKYCLLFDDMETIGHTNEITEHYILTKKRKTGVANIFHHFLTRIHDQRIIGLYLNRLNYCILDEIAQAINWHKVIWKSSLISELKRGVKKALFVCCKGKLFCFDESFVSHDTKRWKLFKRIKSNVSDRASKDKSL